MLGELSWQQQSHSGLDLPGGDGAPLVVVGQPGRLGSDPLEDVVDEAVHDGHGLGGDASVGVDLLEHLVDVDPVGLLPLLAPATLLSASSLLSLGGINIRLARLLDGLADSLGRHLCC